MNTLVLKPGRQVLGYAWVASGRDGTDTSGRLPDYRGTDHDDGAIRRSLRRIRDERGAARGPSQPAVIAVRVTHGGQLFRGATRVTAGVVEQLGALVPHAPLHLPAVLGLIEACATVFPAVPVVLVFETGFFADMAPREYLYGLDVEMQTKLGLRRYGFHGLFHEAAVSHVTRRWHEMGFTGLPRILSICIEPRPELAAVAGHRPLMVTSGTAPLEGLPGYTTCGEMDPGIVLTLAQKLGWGPEQIDQVLTRESGLTGLVGRPTTWEELFGPDRNDVGLQRAREVIEYRLLLACGAGIAAMGGLDALVFSGRSAAVGQIVGPWLVSRLPPPGRLAEGKVTWECFREPLERVIAERASAAILETSGACVA
jgi:acetate kinase